MSHVDYLALRLIRRHLPNRVVRLLLARRIFIKPGLETTAPGEAVQRFLDAIAAAGETVAGRRILVFGYGGNYGVGLGLLQAGAAHVVLLDPYAEPSREVNQALAKGSPYLIMSGSEVIPHPRWLTVVHVPLGRYLADGGTPVDLLLSNSVLEHVEDVAGTIPDLARATAPGGQQFHFIDMRDHYFKYPFEMLCHSEKVWRRFLNPGSNLNRLRAWDYERLFSTCFKRVSVEPLAVDLPAFRAARPRIRPEFLTGQEDRDAVTRVFLRASLPA
jgi:methyltransferase family protein